MGIRHLPYTLFLRPGLNWKGVAGRDLKNFEF